MCCSIPHSLFMSTAAACQPSSAHCCCLWLLLWLFLLLSPRSAQSSLLFILFYFFIPTGLPESLSVYFTGKCLFFRSLDRRRGRWMVSRAVFCFCFFVSFLFCLPSVVPRSFSHHVPHRFLPSVSSSLILSLIFGDSSRRRPWCLPLKYLSFLSLSFFLYFPPPSSRCDIFACWLFSSSEDLLSSRRARPLIFIFFQRALPPDLSLLVVFLFSQ